MNKTDKHYYIYAGKRYDNMKDCRESIGTGIPTRAFKHMLRLGIVQKKLNIKDANNGTLNNSHEYDEQTKKI